jgi:hypothetical protein
MREGRGRLHVVGGRHKRAVRKSTSCSRLGRRSNAGSPSAARTSSPSAAVRGQKGRTGRLDVPGSWPSPSRLQQHQTSRLYPLSHLFCTQRVGCGSLRREGEGAIMVPLGRNLSCFRGTGGARCCLPALRRARRVERRLSEATVVGGPARLYGPGLQNCSFRPRRKALRRTLGHTFGDCPY